MRIEWVVQVVSCTLIRGNSLLVMFERSRCASLVNWGRLSQECWCTQPRLLPLQWAALGYASISIYIMLLRRPSQDTERKDPWGIDITGL